MRGSYPINRYSRADRPELLEFLARVYSPAESVLHSTQWDWKYDNNPLNRAAEPFILLLRDGDALIGMLGAIPLWIAVQGTEYPIVHACDLIVASEYRGARLSERLITEYMRLNPVGFGWLNGRSHRRAAALKRSGWTRLTALVKPLKPLKVFYALSGQNHKHADLAPALAPLLNTLLPFTPVTQNGIIISQCFDFDARFDVLWNRVRNEFPVIGARDSRFLNWRYCQRPDVSYLILAATKGEDMLGYLVVRLTERNALRFGYFVDIAVAGISDQTARCLLQSGSAWLKSNGAAAVKCFVTTPRWRRVLYAHGFLPQFWGSQPYFHSRSDRTEPVWQAYRDVKSWFLTMGDGDFEISL